MNLANKFCYFFDEDEFVETDRPGFRRRVITGDHLQLCFWRIDGGSEGSFLHKHDDNESDENRDLLETHQADLAPKGVWHGQSVFVGDEELDECWILDVFSPPRDDLRAAAGQG